MDNPTPQQPSPSGKNKTRTRNIVVGQKVSSIKVERAKELRAKMTQEEKILWQQLRANRFHGLHFRRQQIIDGFIVDFYCHSAGLVIEVDGEIHQEQVEYDRERDRILSERGLLLLRIKNEEVIEDLSHVLLHIYHVCCKKNSPPIPFSAREEEGLI